MTTHPAATAGLRPVALATAREGAVLVADADAGAEPYVLVLLEHAVTDARSDAAGNRRTVSRRFEFVELRENGDPRPGGYAPYLDRRPATRAELTLVAPLLAGMA